MSDKLSKAGSVLPPVPLLAASAIFLWFGFTHGVWFAIFVGWYEFVLPPHPQFASSSGYNFDTYVIMRIVVSLLVLIAALWTILSKRYAPADRNWAYAAVGTIIGYWLNG